MPTEIQTFLFSRSESPSEVNGGDGWTDAAARAWLRDHDYKAPEADETENFLRYRQFDPARCEADSYVTLTENLPKGIQASACSVAETGRSAESGPRFREVRSLFAERPELELRIEGTAAEPRIVGYAAVWDEETELYPGYREVVRRGAFSSSIGRDDVLGLFEHRDDRLLARSSAGTLELAEDDHGLRYVMTPRPATWIREDVLEPIRRRELRGSSFGFYTIQDRVTRDEDKRGELRELLEATLIDVSPVARPAYPGTEVALRSRAGDLPALLLALRRQGLDDPQIRAAFEAGLAELPKASDSREKPETPAPRKPDPDYWKRLRAQMPPIAGGETT